MDQENLIKRGGNVSPDQLRPEFQNTDTKAANPEKLKPEMQITLT